MRHRRKPVEGPSDPLLLHMHPALMSALYGLARHEECTLEQLVVKLINDGLTVRLKISEIRVLEQVQRRDTNQVMGSTTSTP
jgi:hypothetical protein